LIEKIENQNIFFKRMAELNVKLVSIGPEDIADGTHTTLVLGLTWALICHFGGISEQGSHELFDWIRQNVDPAMLKGGYIDCLKDGKVLCALLLAYDPLCIDKTVAQRGGKEAIEAAFAAGAEFGAPRLIDTNDLSEGSIDIRSVTTYLVMLQSAVLQHDGRRAELANKEAAGIVLAANNEAAWVASVTEQMKQHTVHARGLSMGDRSAIAQAEQMVDSLDKDLLSGKEDHKKKLKALEEQQGKLMIRMQDRPKFVHGNQKVARLTVVQPVGQGDGDVPSRSVDEVCHLLDDLLAGWAEMEKTEKAFRAAIDEVLTERQTDAMMAGIEATAAAIAEAARARTVLLIELQLGDLATMAEAQAAASALETWATQTKADLDSKASLVKSLAEVAKRCKVENREPPPELSHFEGIYSAALEESAAAASLLRRQVADKISASVAALNQITDTWKRIDGPLSSSLPVDPAFVKPTTPGGACVIC